MPSPITYKGKRERGRRGGGGGSLEEMATDFTIKIAMPFYGAHILEGDRSYLGLATTLKNPIDAVRDCEIVLRNFLRPLLQRMILK